MIKVILKKVLGSVVGRWVTGALVASLLGGAALMWHSHKEGLKEDGYQECIQEINQATVDALEDALADSESANAALRASLIAAARVNAEARARHHEAESTLITLRQQMEAQRNQDETYREWSNAPLPDGVADRLREAAGSAPGSTD